MNAVVLGATGLCGSFFLKYAKKSNDIAKIYTITRSSLKDSEANANDKGDDHKVVSLTDKNNANWRGMIENDIEHVDIVLTGLATTRSTEGGKEGQYKIDHDLNIELARAAREKGCKTLVVVSSAGANADSRFFYMKMKGEIERDLANLGFERTIILRPGILLGNRHKNHKGFGNGSAVMVGNWFYRSRLQWLAGYPVQAEEVGKVGVYLASQKSESNKKVQIVESNEILEIAKKI